MKSTNRVKIFQKRYEGLITGVKVSDLPKNLMPTDIIDIEKEEGFHKENNGMDDYSYLYIYRDGSNEIVMNKNEIYSWENIHKIIYWVENFCKKHPNFKVRYRLKIVGNLASIDIGEETYHFEGCFIASCESKKKSVCEVLFQFIHWYRKYDKITQEATDFVENYISVGAIK